MTDIVSPTVRSAMMAGIRSKNTQPELLLRQALHASGFRYRLHIPNLPGCPDLVFRKYRAVVFAHGCFWHGHGCHLFKWPNTRPEFWRDKINKNRENDVRVLNTLVGSGWRVGVVWECALKGKTQRPLNDVVALCSAWFASGNVSLEISGLEYVL